MNIGFLVFSVGLLVAIIGAAKPAAKIGEWPDTTLYFVIGSIVAGLGLYLWRKASSVVHSATEGDGEQESAQSLLKGLGMHINLFEKKYEHFSAEDLEAQTGAFLENYVHPIVEQRYELIQSLGMSKGAEIFLEFAKGERFMNRMQTAALDGHKAEAHRMFPAAKQAFTSAINKLET